MFNIVYIFDHLLLKKKICCYLHSNFINLIWIDKKYLWQNMYFWNVGIPTYLCSNVLLVLDYSVAVNVLFYQILILINKLFFIKFYFISFFLFVNNNITPPSIGVLKYFLIILLKFWQWQSNRFQVYTQEKNENVLSLITRPTLLLLIFYCILLLAYTDL